MVMDLACLPVQIIRLINQCIGGIVYPQLLIVVQNKSIVQLLNRKGQGQRQEKLPMEQLQQAISSLDMYLKKSKYWLVELMVLQIVCSRVTFTGFICDFVCTMSSLQVQLEFDWMNKFCFFIFITTHQQLTISNNIVRTGPGSNGVRMCLYKYLVKTWPYIIYLM